MRCEVFRHRPFVFVAVATVRADQIKRSLPLRLQPLNFRMGGEKHTSDVELSVWCVVQHHAVDLRGFDQGLRHLKRVLFRVLSGGRGHDLMLHFQPYPWRLTHIGFRCASPILFSIRRDRRTL